MAQWSKPILVTKSSTGEVGRPVKHVNSDWPQEAVSVKRHLTWTELAKVLRIHCNTLRYKLKNLGLHQQFSNLTDLDLDQLLQLYKQLQPESCLQYTTSFL